MRLLLEYDREEDELGITEVFSNHQSTTDWGNNRWFLGDINDSIIHRLSIIREERLPEIYLIKFIQRCPQAIDIISKPTEKMKRLHKMLWEI